MKMESSGFLSYSQLSDEEDPPDSETGIEEGDGRLVEIFADILPKDEPVSRIRPLRMNKFQEWYESKAGLMKLGFRYLQNLAGVSTRESEEGDDLESGTRTEKDKTTRTLPDDIVVEILIRAHFKTIIRCRCVSKTWRSWISEPYFINMQLLKNHSSTNADDYVIFSNKKIDSSGFHFHYLCGYDCVTKRLQLPSRPSMGFRHFLPSGAEKTLPHCPSSRGFFLSEFELVGSCNGLLCLFGRQCVLLWNPLINRMMFVEETEMSGIGIVGGIGFFPQTMDYKVVKICHGLQGGEDMPPTVQIFSTSTNSWKNVAQNNSGRWLIRQNCPAPFVQGSLHWCAGSEQRNVILCFDVSEEAFREIVLPVDRGITKITEFRGRITCFFDNPVDEYWEVWVMNEYRVEGSWTKLYTFGHVHGIPLEIMNDGEVLLSSSNGNLLLFDPTTQNHGREFEVKPGNHDVVAYKGSFALLNEGNQSRMCLLCGLKLMTLLVQCIALTLHLLMFCLTD